MPPEPYSPAGDGIQQNVELAGQCRFRIGGPADWFAAVSDAPQLDRALQFARDNALRCFVYSGGSNLFFDSAGFRGLVIRVQGGGFRVVDMPDSSESVETSERSSPSPGVPTANADSAGPGRAVQVASGYDLPQLVRELGAMGLGGIEFLGNIPGSVGGAVVGNAGCYGQAIAAKLLSAELVEVATGAVQTVGPQFFEFAYRHSRLKDQADYVVTKATLRLVEREAGDILGEVEAELQQRLSKHPHFADCAGSFFKNPVGMPAWKVITAAGLAEAHSGRAALHVKHANFLVNAGGATSDDVIALSQRVRRAVHETAGIELEPEVRYVSPAGVAEF